MLVFTTASGCMPSNSDHVVTEHWRAKQQRNLTDYAAQLGPDTQLDLNVTHIAPLSEDVLLLGGAYRTSALAYRSVLLRSTDGGAHWEDTGVWLTSSSVWDIHVLDARHAWVVTCWATEGRLPPFDVCRTNDGGETWTRSRHRLPFEPVGIASQARLSFASPRRGQFHVVGSTGETYRYVTDDGGRTWQLAHSSSNRDAKRARGQHSQRE